MLEKLQVRVINLDRSPERLQSVSSDLDALRVGWERYKAVEPSLTNYLDHELYDARAARRLNGVDLNRGQLGCFLSHLGVLEAFLSSSDDFLLVLEDDVAPDRDSVQLLSGVLDYVRENPALEWHCLNLTETYGKRRGSVANVGSWCLYRAYCFPILTSGLLWSRAGAESFLNHVRDRGIFLPVDQQLRFHLAKTGMGLSLDRPAIRLAHWVSTIQLPSDVLKRHHVSRLLRNVHNYWYAFWARI